MQRRFSSVAALAGAAFASAAVCTVAINAATGSDAPNPAAEVKAGVAQQFAVLREDSPARSSLSRTQDAQLLADTGVNPQLARTGSAADGDVTVLSPSRTGLCLGSTETGVLTCGDEADAVTGKIVGAIVCGRIPADEVQVMGAFPDGVKQVTATLSDGGTATYDIARNSFIARFAKDRPVPLTFSFTTENGTRQTVRTGVPSSGSLSCGG